MITSLNDLTTRFELSTLSYSFLFLSIPHSEIRTPHLDTANFFMDDTKSQYPKPDPIFSIF